MTTFTRFDQNRIILEPASLYCMALPCNVPILSACVMILIGKMNWLAMVRIIERAVGNTVFDAPNVTIIFPQCKIVFLQMHIHVHSVAWGCNLVPSLFYHTQKKAGHKTGPGRRAATPAQKSKLALAIVTTMLKITLFQ